MPTGTITEIVKVAPISAPLRAVFPSLAEKTLSMKSKATTSPNPNARMPAQLTIAPLSGSVSPLKSR